MIYVCIVGVCVGKCPKVKFKATQVVTARYARLQQHGWLFYLPESPSNHPWRNKFSKSTDSAFTAVRILVSLWTSLWALQL